MKKILILFVAVLLPNCQSSGPKLANLNNLPKDAIQLQNIRQITSVGDNTEPKFHPNGQSLLYVSGSRPNHSQQQVYEYRLAPQSEHRIAFHDGNDYSPAYHPNGQWIIYTSETDELKENPEYIHRQLGEQSTNRMTAQGLEIYMSRPDGSQIQRLTQHLGYDADFDIHPSGSFINYVSEDKGDYFLQRLGSLNKTPTTLVRRRLRLLKPTYGKNGTQLFWLEQEGPVVRLWTGPGTAQTKMLKEFNGTIQGMQWTPDGEWLVYSLKPQGNSTFDLYAISSDFKCIKQISNTKFDVSYPALSADGKKITFAGRSTDTYQIYLADFNLPQACLPEQQ